MGRALRLGLMQPRCGWVVYLPKTQGSRYIAATLDWRPEPHCSKNKPRVAVVTATLDCMIPTTWGS